MGKRCKVLIVAIMIAAIAVTGGIVSLGSANADNEILDTTRYVTVSGATVTAAQDLTAEGSGNIHKGLLISPETTGGTYSGKINGIFKTDMKITFSLPTEKQSSGAAGRVDLTVRFADVNDANNYFDVEYYNCGWDGWYTAAAVKDNEGHYRTTRYDNSKTIYDEKYTSGEDAVIYYPFAGDVSGGENGISGYLGLEWDESGVLNVYAPSKNSSGIGIKYTIAKFDSDEYSASDGANSFYGLKKIAFENGFTVSYIAKSKNYNSKDITTPILIESVTTKGADGADEKFSFENATAAAEPSWFAEYAKIPQISLGDNVIKAKYKDSFTVPEASYSFPVRGSDSAVCAKAEYSTDGGATYNETAAGEILEAAGSYKLRYTAVEGSSLPGNTAEYSFVIMDEYFDNASAVSVTGATVTAGADKSGSVTHKGLLIAPAEEKGAYSGRINGTFNGNSSIKFNFVGTLYTGGNHNARAIDFAIRVADASDENNYFDIVWFRDGWNGWFNAAAVVDKNGNIRVARAKDGTIFDKKTASADDNALNSLPYYGGNDSPSGMLEFVWEGDVLAIYSRSIENNRFALAKFDGTAAIDNDASPKTFGLGKIAFPNGYTISFNASATGDENTVPLLLEEINGVSLASKMLAPEKMVLDEENCALLGNEVVIVNGTNDVKTAAELGLGARFPYTVAFGSLTVRAEKTILATVPALNEYATTPLTYTYLGKTLNQSVTVVNAAPVVTLNVAATENFRMGGPNASTLTLGAGDVTATDLVDGKEGVTVKIYVKAPSAADFTEVTDGSAFAPTETGEYIVKYVGVDKDGNASAGTTRSIVVIDGKVPVIVVDEIADSALIKSSITVPTATATDGGDETTPLDVTFKVIYKVNVSDVTGEELSVAEGEKMTFDRAGTYVFVYYAIDADGNEIDKTFAVTVRPDTDRPVLTVEGGTDNVTATKGEEITVRPATAADEVDGNVTVIVKVTFGVTEVTVTDGKFVAENEGVYSVTYTASDEAGNTAEVTYSVAVSPVAAPEKKGCGKQTARDLAIMLGSLSAILAAALFVGKKG